LCRAHHQDLHRHGNEKAWWSNMQIEPLPIARELWEDVLMHARELYIVYEGLIISAQHRRTMLLREIEGRRHRIRGSARNTSQKYSATRL